MAGEAKPISAYPNHQNILQSPSLKTFSSICSEVIEGFQPEKALVLNPQPGDETFAIDYQHSDKDLFCHADVNWKKQEMRVTLGSHVDKVVEPPITLPLLDACHLTTTLAGEEEFQSHYCQDIPLTEKALQYAAVVDFLAEANRRLQDHLKKTGQNPNQKIEVNQVSIFNEDEMDGDYVLRYASREQDFFMEGHVDSHRHAMLYRSGSLKNDWVITEQQANAVHKGVPTNYTCSMTKDLIDPDEVPTNCVDPTPGERTVHEVMDKSLMTYGITEGTWVLASIVKSLATRGVRLYVASSSRDSIIRELMSRGFSQEVAARGVPKYMNLWSRGAAQWLKINWAPVGKDLFGSAGRLIRSGVKYPFTRTWQNPNLFPNTRQLLSTIRSGGSWAWQGMRGPQAASYLANGLREFFTIRSLQTVPQTLRQTASGSITSLRNSSPQILGGLGSAYAMLRTQAPRLLSSAMTGVRTAGAELVAGFGSTMLPLGAGTFTAEVGALGGATVAGWVGLAFGVGVGIGIGINYMPKLWGGREVGDHIADGIEAVAGKPSQTTMDVLDHMGFGGWGCFKANWKQTLGL